MRAFTCGNCGALLFFENSLCLRCSHPLGFMPSQMEIIVVDETGPGAPRRCANAELAQCTWLVDSSDPAPLCRSCRLTRTRPGDADQPGLEEFAQAERAKRRLIFQLLDLGLPIEDDLAFELLSSETAPVVTGHADGVITLDLAESDDVRREQRRTALHEPYRTLLGHFRHEIGHYYQPILVDREGEWDRCRELFGDERASYQEALDRHYQAGPPANWEEGHVSAYATMHPWEDWAETFAHYLHILDTLETAASFGIVVRGPEERHDGSMVAAPGPEVLQGSFAAIIGNWLPLTIALNAVNRSMGSRDLYPFALGTKVLDKLAFVDERVVHKP